MRSSRPGRAKLGIVELVGVHVGADDFLVEFAIKLMHLDRTRSKECDLGAVGSPSSSFARPGRLERTCQ